MKTDDLLREALAGVEAKFPFIEGLESGSRFRDLAAGEGLDGWLPKAEAWWSAEIELQRSENFERLQRLATPNESVNRPLPPDRGDSAAEVAKWILRTTADTPPSPSGARWMAPWPVRHFVWQAPEGSGKSSIVPELVGRGFTVVFCSKSNDQLVEQQASFKSRWPDMRIHRYVSRARFMQEQLAELGIEFKPVYYAARSPYSGEGVDEPSTRQALRSALDEHGYQHIDHVQFFDKVYTHWKSPRIVSKDTDVVLLTMAAFRAFCTAKHRPWWEALGLGQGRKRVIGEYDKELHFHESGTHAQAPSTVQSDIHVPSKHELGYRQRTVEIGLEKIIVVIDDPDRTDFDFRRLIEEKRLADIYRQAKALPKYQRDWVFVDHWRKQGYPKLLAQRLANEWTQKAHEHQVAAFEQRQYEERPVTTYLGYGLQRGFSRKSGMAPKMLVLTTEHVTTRLAADSLGRVMKHRWSVLGGATEQTPYGHVTLLSTRIVRKANKALLLIVEAKLRQEFPDEQVTLIADGLGCELNLMNNKGRNDLTERSTIIKLSIPHPSAALNLWAQFPTNKRRAVLNTILLADLANQAIGRNQGNRWKGKPCLVLVDPMYAKFLAESGLLRYHCTPWSFHRPLPSTLTFHGPTTELERRMKELLEPGQAANLAMGRFGLQVGSQMTDMQWSIYEEWLDRNHAAIPKELRRNAEDQDRT